MASQQTRFEGRPGSPRGSVALGCLVYETLWSLYLGRPSHISLSTPSVPPSAAETSDNPSLKAWFQLCVLITEITMILNDPIPLKFDAINRLSELDRQLRGWYTALPPDIALHDDNISNLDAVSYGLHMQYLRMQMLLHSLPGSKSMLQKQDGRHEPSPVLHGWTSEASARLVHLNALKIARLGITYRQMFGVEKTPSVMLDNLYLAATTLVSTILKAEDPSASENDIRWLRLLDGMMQDLQVHYRITARMRRTLGRLVEGCPMLIDVFTNDVYNSPDHSSTHGGFLGSSGRAWGSFEAAINESVFDPSLFNFIDFEMIDHGAG